MVRRHALAPFASASVDVVDMRLLDVATLKADVDVAPDAGSGHSPPRPASDSPESG